MALVRQGIGHESRVLSQDIDWTAIKALADTHGLSAVVLDGVNGLSGLSSLSSSAVQGPAKQFLLQWIGEVMQSYEGRYAAYEKAIGSLAGFYNQHGYKMMVLKGYASSLDWPNPKHRPCGDIDIWQFGKQKEADAVLAKEKGVKLDTSHHHHTVFDWQGFTVENHYDFINVHHHKSNVEFEAILKELGSDGSHHVEVDGERVYLPSPDLHALFLLKHTMMHFASEGIMLRQVLDWAFFVKSHSSEIDWEWLEDILEQYGMKRLYDIYNAICVDDLGFDVNLFPRVQFDPTLKDRVLLEILSPKYPIHNLPKNVFKRVLFKIRRWKDSAWKHRLCYNDSMWSSFWSGVWMHLLKPSQI